MATVGDDCYFFCTSTCSKGANCPFRHVEAAKTCRIICQHWQMGGCLRPSCKFRHSDFHIQVNPTEIACYWETQPSGCKKSNCPFKHSKPRPEQQEDVTKAAANPSSQSENTSAENGTNSPAVKFVTPVVEPVVIEPDSEASNSSPVKSLEKRKTDDQKESLIEGVKEKGKDLHEEDSTSTDNAEKKKSVDPKKTRKGNLKKNTEKIPRKKKNVETNKKGTIQKKQEKSSPKEVKRQKAPPKKAGVKGRLGTAHKEPEQIPEEETSGSESTDSDDSIENVKVLSMEEIFRQKALESMMKKRASEGKPMLPPSIKAARRPASSPSKPPSKIVIKSPVKEAPKPKKEQLKRKVEEEEESDAEEEEEDSGEDEEEDDEVEETEDEETEDEEEDSSETSSSESSESEEEIEAPRRVIIDIDDDEKLRRRKKANKSNLQKRALVKSDVKVRKREVIREPAVQEEPPSKKSKQVAIHRPSDIRKRLGKPVAESKEFDWEEKSKRFATKRKLIVEDERFLEDREESDEDTNLGGIKIKTLGEIRAEKARRLQDNIKLSPQKEQQVSGTQPLRRTIMLKDEEKESALSDPGPVGTVEKKTKKRPWKHQKTAPQPQEEGDHRTVSAAAPKSAGGAFEDELEQYKATQKKEEVSPESPTESLRRRALLKKAQSKGLMRESEEVLKKSSSKKSKHKHKHKKKSKIERQLYVPPALKSSGGKSLLSDEEIAAHSDEEKPQNSAEASYEANEKVAPQRAVAQRVGALWAAGLNASSKGLGARIVPKKEIVKETKPPLPKAAPIPLTKKAPSDDSLPTIKTFSQIMAEKRQKRLELQQQTKKAIPSSESIAASIQSESNPRVPISPIVFNSGDASRHLTQSSTSSSMKASLKTSSNLINEDSPSPSKLSSSVKQDFNTLRNEKSKKFFKKPILKEVSLHLDQDSSAVNKRSQSLETTSKAEVVVKSTAPTSPCISPLLSETEPASSTEKPHKRRSLEDEFSFFDDDDLDDAVIPDDVEPIDDLLQDIDSLLA